MSDPTGSTSLNVWAGGSGGPSSLPGRGSVAPGHADAYGMPKWPESPVDATASPAGRGPVIPHPLTFGATWNSQAKAYYSRYDEALRSSWTNAVVMRRDGYVDGLLRHRKLPTVSAAFHLDPEDPNDAEQMGIASALTEMVGRIPRLQDMKIALMEGVYYGRAASSLEWDIRTIKGVPRTVPVRHTPVNGDKIQFAWDGTPGIYVNPGWRPERRDSLPYLRTFDNGNCFFLADPADRCRYVIHRFEPTDSDWLQEADMAGAAYGLGLRSRLYHLWDMRTELRGFIINSMERVGLNGQYYGFYEEGNARSAEEMKQSILDLTQFNVAMFPRSPNAPNAEPFNRLAPETAGYGPMMEFLGQIERDMQMIVLGQELTSGTAPTGMGSGVAEAHKATFDHVVRYDATSLGETLEADLLGPLIRLNRWDYKGRTYYGRDLPFRIKWTIQVDSEDAAEKIETATKLASIGVPTDAEKLRDDAGLAAPKPGAGTTTTPTQGVPAGEAGKPAGASAPHPAGNVSAPAPARPAVAAPK